MLKGDRDFGNSLEIAGRQIGPGQPVFVVAEMSANHGGSLSKAVEILRAACDAGADAVKLQTYTPDTMTLDSERPEFSIGAGTLWEGRRLHELYAEAATPWEWHPELMQVGNSLGLPVFSSPFDASAVEFLESLDTPAYKVASFELVDLPLIERVGRTGKPVIVSTGMADRKEISEALDALRGTGTTEVALLHCTSAYPAPPEEMDLRTIPDMVTRFGVPVGLSDHTMDAAIPVASVALGACIVEKHFTLSRDDPGPDSAFSLEPGEFRSMVDSIRVAEAALGEVRYRPSEREAASRMFRRSIFVTSDVSRGEIFTEENLRVIRPGHGLAPKHLSEVLGKRSACNVSRGTPLAWEHLEVSES